MLTRTLLLTFCAAGSCVAGVVKLKELRTTRLPYGEGITISGELQDLAVTDPDGKPVKVVDLMDIDALSVTYTVSGLAPKKADAQIEATHWQVSIDALPENASVKFVFRVSGTDSACAVASVIGGLIADDAYKAALEAFFKASEAQPSTVVKEEAKKFIQALVPIVTRKLKLPLKSSEGKPLPETLLDALQSRLIDALSNLPARLQDLGEVKGLPIERDAQGRATLTGALELAQKIKAPAQLVQVPEGQRSGVFSLIQRFKHDYVLLESALAKSVSAGIAVEASLSEETGVKDFEKYAGIDLGAIYAPRVQALQGFFTVNVYLSAMEENPAPTTASTNWSRFGQQLRQRFSLTFGVTVGDLSGQQRSEIKQDNAFLYGVGLRLNKYFRLVSGAMVYRSAVDDQLKHGFFIGPSVDVTAFHNIRSVFGKVKP